MATVTVVALITPKPGSEAPLKEALEELVTATREEPGCLSYELFRSSVTGDGPAPFVMVERWADQQSLDTHLGAPAIAKTFATAGDYLAGAPAIHQLTALA